MPIPKQVYIVSLEIPDISKVSLTIEYEDENKTLNKVKIPLPKDGVATIADLQAIVIQELKRFAMIKEKFAVVIHLGRQPLLLDIPAPNDVEIMRKHD